MSDKNVDRDIFKFQEKVKGREMNVWLTKCRRYDLL